MELILESPLGLSIKVRHPTGRQQAKLIATMTAEDRTDFIMEIAEFIALNCTDTDYTDPEVAKKYDVDLLETQSTTEMATEALIRRYSLGVVTLWGESLLDKLGLTDKGLERLVNKEKNTLAPAEPSQ